MTTIPSKRKKHRNQNRDVRLQLTSMMDMFTIILVFLLKTYSTHGQLVSPSQDLTLPTSTIQQEPELGLDVTVSHDWILVNNQAVAKVSTILQQEEYIIPALKTVLDRYGSEAEKMEEMYGAKFSGKVTIQGNKDIPYKLLIRVMYTCGQSSYPNMRLVVYREEA